MPEVVEIIATVAEEEVVLKPIATHRKLSNIFNQKKVKVVDKIAQAEQLILSDKALIDIGTGDSNFRFRANSKYLESHIFMREITPYGFELVALVYHLDGAKTSYKVHEAEDTVITKKIDRIYELTYNLRDKKASVLKNGKELSFREGNLQAVFAGHNHRDLLKQLDEMTGIDNMYTVMYDIFGSVGKEMSCQLARFFERFMELNKAELIYKSGVPVQFAKRFAQDLALTVTPEVSQYSESYTGKMQKMRAVSVDLTETNPAKLLGVNKNIFKLIQADVIGYDEYITIADVIRQIRTNSMYADKMEKANQAIARACNYVYGVYQYALELDTKYGMKKSDHVIWGETKMLLKYESGIVEVTPNGFHQYTASVAYLSRVVHADYKRMLEYCYYQIDVEQGYNAYNVNGYNVSGLDGITNSIYKDYLSLSYQLSARRDLYPKYLKTQHDILARNKEVISNELLKEQFNDQLERYKQWEDVKVKGTKYVMIAPTSLADLGDEATQMGNCVASYADNVAKGVTSIMFMREDDTPDKSLITVELREGCLWQAYQRFNYTITKEQAEFLKKWCKKADIELAYRVPVLGGETL